MKDIGEIIETSLSKCVYKSDVLNANLHSWIAQELQLWHRKKKKNIRFSYRVCFKNGNVLQKTTINHSDCHIFTWCARLIESRGFVCEYLLIWQFWFVGASSSSGVDTEGPLQPVCDGPNEVLRTGCISACIDDEQSCAKLGQRIICAQYCREGSKCVCDAGFYRNSNNVCGTPEQCNESTSSSNSYSNSGAFSYSFQ